MEYDIYYVGMIFVKFARHFPQCGPPPNLILPSLFSSSIIQVMHWGLIHLFYFLNFLFPGQVLQFALQSLKHLY